MTGACVGIGWRMHRLPCQVTIKTSTIMLHCECAILLGVFLKVHCKIGADCEPWFTKQCFLARLATRPIKLEDRQI